MANAKPVHPAPVAPAVITEAPAAEVVIQPIAERAQAPALKRAPPAPVDSEAIEGLYAEAVSEGKSAQLFERAVRIDN